MAEEPNETARQAFGEGPMPPVPPQQAVAESQPPPSATTTPTPTPTQAAGALAEWGTRAAAFVLDGLFLFGITFAITLAVSAVAGTDERTVETIVYAVAIPLGLLYAPLLMMRSGKTNGQTFGKQMMDIRVVRTDGERVTFWNGVLRQVIGQQLLMGLTLYVYAFVDYLWPLRDPRNQALHDKIASTLVVRTKAGGLPQPPAAAPPRAAESIPPPPSRGVDEAPVRSWLPPSAGG